MSKIHKLHKEALQAKFIKSYDFQSLSQIFRAWQSRLPLNLDFLGAGQHFQAYRLCRQDIDMVLKFGRQPNAWIKSWTANLAVLEKLELAHIPPQKLTIDWDEGFLMQVMPYGLSFSTHAGTDSEKASQASLATTRAQLVKAGLDLGDIEQIKWIDIVPYIVDLSSLIAI